MVRSLGLAWSMAAVSLLGACTTDAGASFYIIHNQVPEEGCDISPDPGPFRARGTVDTLAPFGYIFTPVAQSLVSEAEREDVDRVIFVQGADVTLTFRDAEIASFRQLFSGSIMPGGTTSFGFDILPPSEILQIADQIGETPEAVIAEVKMFGRVEGGDAAAEPYTYPIDVCEGCIVFDVGDCALLAEDFEPTALGGECNPAQDEPVQCCTAGNGDFICPAVPGL